MSGWSFSVGKIFGVDVRLHSFFVFLLFLSMTWAALLGRPMLRGVALWGLILLALGVRETARALAGAWFGLDVRSILMLPTGGIPTYATSGALSRAGEPQIQRWMALVGPLANLLFGATAAGLILAVAPSVNLTELRWVTPAHLLRTMVWVNLLLAAVNFLPAWPLDAGRVAASGAASKPYTISEGVPRDAQSGLRMLASMGPAIAIGLILFGVLSANFWVIMAGIGILLGAQVERQGLLVQTGADSVRVKDVMLAEYSILSASATLEDAVEKARHTLQDVFPVVRAGNMVGAVARQHVVDALNTSGNGYVQGIMTRSFQTAAPQDSLIETLGKVTGQAGSSSQLVVVMDGGESDRILGIITPQNLQRSMGLLARKPDRPGSRGSFEDEVD